MLEMGAMPASITVTLSDELADCCQAGGESRTHTYAFEHMKGFKYIVKLWEGAAGVMHSVWAGWGCEGGRQQRRLRAAVRPLSDGLQAAGHGGRFLCLLTPSCASCPPPLPKPYSLPLPLCTPSLHSLQMTCK